MRRCFTAGILVALAGLAVAGEPATSPRSREVVERVAPRMARELAAHGGGLELGAPIFLRIFKEARELEVWVEGETDPSTPGAAPDFVLFRTYRICRISGKLGPKTAQGDRQGPEGFYFVTPARLNPRSRYHLSFDLGYPNAYDRARGRTGSALMVHGNCVSIGCYAMTDEGIEEIYTLADAALRGGQPFFRVHVFPFRLEEKALAKMKLHRWHDFWTSLKEGYDWFEREGRPPNVELEGGRYHFEFDGAGAS